LTSRNLAQEPLRLSKAVELIFGKVYSGCGRKLIGKPKAAGLPDSYAHPWRPESTTKATSAGSIRTSSLVPCCRREHLIGCVGLFPLLRVTNGHSGFPIRLGHLHQASGWPWHEDQITPQGWDASTVGGRKGTCSSFQRGAAADPGTGRSPQLARSCTPCLDLRIRMQIKFDTAGNSAWSLSSPQAVQSAGASASGFATATPVQGRQTLAPLAN